MRFAFRYTAPRRNAAWTPHRWFVFIFASALWCTVRDILANMQTRGLFERKGQGLVKYGDLRYSTGLVTSLEDDTRSFHPRVTPVVGGKNDPRNI